MEIYEQKIKIPFDIALRKQIQSEENHYQGRYKVQTRSGKPGRIICWDKNNSEFPIVALIKNRSSNEVIEFTHSFSKNGKYMSDNVEHSFDLCLVDTWKPELKESEDERIRKDLIKYLESDRDCQPCQDVSFYDSSIAWLEKQKESGIKWFKSDNLKNPDKPYIDKAGMFYTTDGRMCYVSEIEKHKEQKPVDLVKEEYIENRNDGTFTFDNTEKEPAHNELTIEDIKELDRIHLEIENEMGFEESDAFYKEVLKRFKKYKYGNAKEDTDINGTEG